MKKNIEKAKDLFGCILEEKEVQKYSGKLKKYHKQSYRHSLRVGQLCVELGYRNSFPKKDIKLLGYSGLLHDIGKLDISKDVLKNGFKLTKKGREIINGHPRIGFCKLNNFKYEEIGKIIVMHHEHNINPYPRIKKDRRKIKRETGCRRKNCKRIDRLSQIVAIADLYDALSNNRNYKKSFNKKKIKELIQKEFTGDKKYLSQIINCSQ